MAESAGNNDKQRRLSVNAQYVKDLSFESPNSPASLVPAKEQPKIDLSVDIAVQKLQEEAFEVVLKIHTKAATSNHTLFITELSYAGVFTIANIAGEELERLLLIYCPGLLFPFARRIIADVTRDGGFPPLMVDPIDFSLIYQQRQQEAKKVAAN